MLPLVIVMQSARTQVLCLNQRGLIAFQKVGKGRQGRRSGKEVSSMVGGAGGRHEMGSRQGEPPNRWSEAGHNGVQTWKATCQAGGKWWGSSTSNQLGTACSHCLAMQAGRKGMGSGRQAGREGLMPTEGQEHRMRERRRDG